MPIRYPLAPLHLRPDDTIGRAVVIGVDITVGDMVLDEYSVAAGDKLSSGRYVGDTSRFQAVVPGWANDVLVVTSPDGHVTLALTVTPPSSMAGPVREWLTGDGEVPIEPGTRGALRRGDEVLLRARWDGAGVRITFEVSRRRPPAPVQPVCVFGAQVAPSPAGPTPWQVVEVAPFSAVLDLSLAEGPMEEDAPRPPAGATTVAMHPVACRRRPQFDEPWDMECPDGSTRKVEDLPRWFADRGNTVPVWRVGGVDWVALPGDQWFRRPLQGRPYWQRVAEGRPAG